MFLQFCFVFFLSAETFLSRDLWIYARFGILLTFSLFVSIVKSILCHYILNKLSSFSSIIFIPYLKSELKLF